MERIFKIIIFLILLVCLVMTIPPVCHRRCGRGRIRSQRCDHLRRKNRSLYGLARMFLLLIGSFLAFLHIFED